MTKKINTEIIRVNIFKHVLPKGKILKTAKMLKSIKETVSNLDLGRLITFEIYIFLILYLPLIVNINIVRNFTAIQHLVIGILHSVTKKKRYVYFHHIHYATQTINMKVNTIPFLGYNMPFLGKMASA